MFSFRRLSSPPNPLRLVGIDSLGGVGDQLRAIAKSVRTNVVVFRDPSDELFFLRRADVGHLNGGLSRGDLGYPGLRILGGAAAAAAATAAAAVAAAADFTVVAATGILIDFFDNFI